MQTSKADTLLCSLLEQWKGVIGSDFDGYKNHCRRMVAFCLAIRSCTDEEQEKVAIAACFHDIGLWTAKTLDYLPPSVIPAVEYLKGQGKEAWIEEITLMITEHHKLRTYTDTRYPLVEAFRKADLVDFSLGMVTFGLPRSLVSQVKGEIPNAGFHGGLVQKASAWFLKHPLNPVPMMKW